MPSTLFGLSLDGFSQCEASRAGVAEPTALLLAAVGVSGLALPRSGSL